MTARLAPFAGFAAVLAMAGLPIYIHAPKYYVDAYGVGLAGLGAVLFGLRLLDVVQDPVLGWLSRRLRRHRGWAVTVAACAMALAMIGLFAVAPPVAPLLWFALTLTVLFSAFSFLTISFYAEGVAKAARLGAGGHVRLAGWRETGALIGISLAATAPAALMFATDKPLALFALLFAFATLAALYAMRGEWQASAGVRAGMGFRPYLANPRTRRLLLLALVNAMPVAVTSTLFLFFVEHRLAAPGWEGPLLLLFFLAAAATVPGWSRLALAIGPKPALLIGMALAILAFGGTIVLGAGDHAAFALICLLSGAALGADMTLLPALFAEAASRIAPEAAEGFGLWSFASKASLAVAAAILLPLLEARGFNPGKGEITENALATLTFLYAVVPLGLKALAITLLALTPLDDWAKPATQRGVHP